MSNRLYSQFKEKKTHHTLDPPPTGKRGNRKGLPKESTATWGGGKGNARSDRGLGYPLVKTFVAGEYIEGNPGKHRRKGKMKTRHMMDKMMY